MSEDMHQVTSGFMNHILADAFGQPRGLLGRLGGILMVRSNQVVAQWVLELLNLQPSDVILEIGFGPGVAIQHISTQLTTGKVVGVEISEEMIAMATARNQEAIRTGNVELTQASVMDLPYPEHQFDVIFAINSLQLWPNPESGLNEVYRVMQSGGTVALGFNHHARPRPNQERIVAMLNATTFTQIRIETKDNMLCILGKR